MDSTAFEMALMGFPSAVAPSSFEDLLGASPLIVGGGGDTTANVHSVGATAASFDINALLAETADMTYGFRCFCCGLLLDFLLWVGLPYFSLSFSHPFFPPNTGRSLT